MTIEQTTHHRLLDFRFHRPDRHQGLGHYAITSSSDRNSPDQTTSQKNPHRALEIRVPHHRLHAREGLISLPVHLIRHRSRIQLLIALQIR